MPASPDREISIPFGTRRIGAGHPVVVIAEIGINHEGSEEACARMIEAAAEAGADAIKLQTVDAEESYVPGTPSHELFSRARLGLDQTARLFDLARSLGIEPFTTSGDMATLEKVDRLGPAAHKVSSGLLTHLPLIRAAARTGRTILMSTGMADAEDIDEAVAAVRSGGGAAFGLFQCTSLYPAPPETLGLAAIGWLEQRYGAPAGLSDHSLGIEAAPLSVAAGARMIEKHFTLDPARLGFDHHLSLAPEAFACMVENVRAAEAMMGAPGKHPDPREAGNAALYRRALVARRDIAAGQRLSAEDVGVMRLKASEQGMPPAALDDVLGRRAARDLKRHTPLSLGDLS